MFFSRESIVCDIANTANIVYIDQEPIRKIRLQILHPSARISQITNTIDTTLSAENISDKALASVQEIGGQSHKSSW